MVKDAALLTSKDRRESEKLATREKILDAAREMFNERGVEATTMRAIADRIGYTATAIYYHFKDKDALLLELCYVDFATLGRTIALAGQIADPIERLRATGLAYVDFGLSNESQYRFMFMTPTRTVTPEEIPLDKENPEESAYAFLKLTVQEALAAGRLRADLSDGLVVANMLWAGMHGVVSLYIGKKHDAWCEFGDPREWAETMVDTMIRGIVADAQ
jgi:AcrR family transcriptional regulator